MGRSGLYAVVVLLGTLLVSSWAQAKSRPVGFSNLVYRLDEDRIGIASGDYRVYILEELRAAGLTAVGAENLVFGKDEARKAELVLGGTVLELECAEKNRKLNCRIGIEWQVLDAGRDVVVYKALTRSAEYGVNERKPGALGKRLVVGALRSLLERDRFLRTLDEEEGDRAAAAKPEYAPAVFGACAASEATMPEASETVTRATVLVRTRGGFGSGFFLGSEGLVMTAAHAVDAAQLELQVRDGTKLKARPIRLSKKHDVALLAIEDGAGPYPCMPLDTEPKATGRDVYAIGAPASQDLAFSVTRGIVSGTREMDGLRLLQTDASVSPGNSGGPLVDDQGRVVAVVSRKFTGEAIEGVAFGVPIEVALSALGLGVGASTDPLLLAADAIRVGAAPIEAARPDRPDPKPSLDPEGDRRRRRLAERRDHERRRKEATPAYVPVMRYGGGVLAGVGLMAAFLTAQEVKPERMTRPEYEDVRLKNDLSWVAAGLGAGCFVASFLLVPEVPKKRKASPGQTRLELTGTSARLHTSF